MVRRALALGFVIAATATPAVATPTQASLGNFVCKQAHNPMGRMIEITATMRTIPGTESMALRFQLLQRLPGARFRKVYGGDLGRWRHPSPPTFGQQPGDTWIVKKPVANLYAPARYRFRVTFRWVSWSGVATTSTLLGPVCVEAR